MANAGFRDSRNADKHNFYLEKKREKKSLDSNIRTKFLIIGLVIMIVFFIYIFTPLHDIWGSGDEAETTAETQAFLSEWTADEGI